MLESWKGLKRSSHEKRQKSPFYHQAIILHATTKRGNNRATQTRQMTKQELRERLVLYVLAAMLTAAATDVSKLRDADTVGIVEFFIKVILAGVITWRAFIDKSVIQEQIQTKAEEVKGKVTQLGLLAAAGGLILFSGCVAKVNIGEDGRYGRGIIGYELPDLNRPHYDRFEQ